MKLIIFLLIFVSSFQAAAQVATFETKADGENLKFKQVAIGIAGPGPGISLMGHAFLLFSTNPDKLSESYAVQFNISDLDSDKEVPGLSSFGLGKRFSLEGTSGTSALLQFRNENRPVILYFLKLDASQISKLWVSLREVYFLRKNNVYRDYSLISNNCLTEMLNQLNGVMYDNQEKFFYYDDMNFVQKMSVRYLGALGLYAQNAPYLAAPGIAKNPLIDFNRTLPPAIILDAKPLLRLEKATELFAKVCDAKNLKKVSIRVNGQPNIRESQAYIDLLSKIRSRCKSAEGAAAYIEIIETIYMLSHSSDAKLRLEKYLP